MIRIFGAQAKVFLRFKGEMQELAIQIAVGLKLINLTVEHSEYPPYELIGSGENLGFELWLNKAPLVVDGFNYVFEMSTELSHDEITNGQMHDLSFWLARYISQVCKIDACVVLENSELIVFNLKK